MFKAYYNFLNGAFGNLYNFSQSLLKTIPLIFTGLAVAIGFKTGLFNIGGEEQLYWGAFATVITALTFSQLKAVLLLPLVLLAGVLAGGLWSTIAGPKPEHMKLSPRLC